MKKLLLILFIVVMSDKLLAPEIDEKQREARFERSLEALIKRDREQRLATIKSIDFNIDLLYEYVSLREPDLHDIPIRQFILETGWFKSFLFTEYNNIAGMRLPRVRSTTAVGEALGHAVYEHWTDSVDDYILWLEYYKEKGYNTENYYSFLKDVGYATFEGYEDRLKSINLEKYGFTKTEDSSCC